MKKKLYIFIFISFILFSCDKKKNKDIFSINKINPFSKKDSLILNSGSGFVELNITLGNIGKDTFFIPVIERNNSKNLTSFGSIFYSKNNKITSARNSEFLTAFHKDSFTFVPIYPDSIINLNGVIIIDLLSIRRNSTIFEFSIPYKKSLKEQVFCNDIHRQLINNGIIDFTPLAIDMQ